ncbi:MAG: 4-hydroxy-tetrahydrodipicolinate synthase [Salinivirgaceae bacterium]
MHSKSLKGTGVALVTPFRKDGSVDFKALEKLLEYVITDGVDYLLALGTTSEYPTLSIDEQTAVVNLIKETNNRRLPLVLGISGNSTSEIVTKIQKTDFTDIDAILSVVPYYNKPSQKGIIQHFSTVAAASPVPVILYNVPGRTGKNMEVDTVVSLAHNNNNIIGIKEASGDIAQVMNIIKRTPDQFMVISGEDALTMPLVAAGASGVISVLANAYPKAFSEMVRAGLNDDQRKAREIHYNLLNFAEMIFEDGNPSGIKAALQIKDITQSAVRLPLTTISRSLYGKLDAEINSIPYEK